MLPMVDKQFERGKFEVENGMTQAIEHSAQTQEESSKKQAQQPKKARPPRTVLDLGMTRQR